MLPTPSQSDGAVADAVDQLVQLVKLEQPLKLYQTPR